MYLILATIDFTSFFPLISKSHAPSHFTLESPSVLFSLGSFPFPAHTFIRRQTEETFGTRRNEGGSDEWLNRGLGEIGNQCRKPAWKRKLTRRERVSARLPRLGYICNAFPNLWSRSIKEQDGSLPFIRILPCKERLGARRFSCHGCKMEANRLSQIILLWRFFDVSWKKKLRFFVRFIFLNNILTRLV